MANIPFSKGSGITGYQCHDFRINYVQIRVESDQKHVRRDETPKEVNWDEVLFKGFHSLFSDSKERFDLVSVLLA